MPGIGRSLRRPTRSPATACAFPPAGSPYGRTTGGRQLCPPPTVTWSRPRRFLYWLVTATCASQAAAPLVQPANHLVRADHPRHHTERDIGPRLKRARTERPPHPPPGHGPIAAGRRKGD